MVKKIIALSDIHIYNFIRHNEYQEVFQKLFQQCQDVVNSVDGGKDDVRIVVCGDIVNSKNDISPEAYMLTSWFLSKLGDIATTYVIAGNHDFNMSNKVRLDPLSSIFAMNKFENVHYLDRECDYTSACVPDDNIMWCLYSSFDEFNRPNIDEMKITNDDKAFIGLFHGDINGATSNTGYISTGVPSSYFEGLDCALCGHIHRHQVLQHDGTKIIYCGTPLQHDHGESVSGHGFVCWDVEQKDFEYVNIENDDYGFYTFEINNESDIDNDTEKVLNLW